MAKESQDSESAAELLEFMLKNTQDLRFIFTELEKYRTLKRRGGGKVGV